MIYFSLGDMINSIPFEIKKYLRREANGLLESNTGKNQYLDILKQFGYEYTEGDIPIDSSILNPDEWDKKRMLDNKEFWELSRFYSNLHSDFVNVINFINSINSEIVYIGSTKLDYKKRINSGQIPIPETYTIYLHNNPIKQKGYFFDGVRFSPKYIFDVRGYRRHFKNKKRYNNLYELYSQGNLKMPYNLDEQGIIYRWIDPFKRGSGLYVKKQYNLTKQEYHKL